MVLRWACVAAQACPAQYLVGPVVLQMSDHSGLVVLL